MPVFTGNSRLPEAFVEELYAMEAMANCYSRGRLKRALEQANLPLPEEQALRLFRVGQTKATIYNAPTNGCDSWSRS
jgi:hypothetical protein